ncbi:MAG: alpha/beta hydrolase-fold protein [bacterium]
MIPHKFKFLKLFFEIFGIIACAVAFLFFLSPNKFINTFRFFPNYNPFAKNIEQTIEAVGQDMSTVLKSSELRKTQLAMNDGSMRNVIVYLPKGYNPKGNRIYPSLYMLHGSPGQETDWLTAGKAKESLDGAILAKILPPTVVVFPDGNGGATNDTQYINSTDGSQLDEDFIIKTVVGYVDNNFLTIKEAKFRAIGGLSSGGFGAINLALRHQDIFGNVVALSGYGIIDQNVLSGRLIQGSQQTIHNNTPLDYIPSLTTTSTKLILIVGRNDNSVIAENRALETALAKKGFDVTLTLANGVHNWKFWSEHLPDGLSWLGRQFKSLKK